jgi:hypothetical protein
MADSIISPDGKWMWTGDDWIPAPPSSESEVQQNINFKDSAIGGDININNNSTSDFITGINHLLEGLGVKEHPTLAKVFPKQETNKDEVDDAQLIALTKMMLLSIMELSDFVYDLIPHLFDMNQNNLVRGCFLRLYYEAKSNDDKALLLVILGACAEHDLREQNRCFAESARIRRENNLDIPEWLEKY